MPKTVAKKSKEFLGVEYRKHKNKNHEFFFCSKCNKDRRTNPYYYRTGDEANLICAECYEKLFNDALQKKQKNIPQSAGVLSQGSTIHIGRKNHKCKKGFEEIWYYLLTSSGKKTLVKLFQCRSCGEIFAKGDRFSPSTFPDYDYVREILQQRQNKLFDMETLTHQVMSTDFLTRMSAKRCIVAGHELLDIQARVKVLCNDYKVMEDVIPASYCRTCEKYFILEADYQMLKEKGTILCNVVEQTYWGKNNNGFHSVSDESLLFKMGYNVNAINNLNYRERQKILETALANKLLTKAEILSHLDYLIRRSQNNMALVNAVNKWKEDREFVRRFHETAASQYAVDSIFHRNYKTKET